MGKRHSAPAATVRDNRVFGELRPTPERDDQPACLEEDDVVFRLRARRPAERPVERASPFDVGNAERDQAEALLHVS